MKSRSVLVVGNFRSNYRQQSHDLCEDLAVRLSQGGWGVVCTSDRRNRVMRLADMLWTAWRVRHDISVAIVDVFSGRAFRWAEATVSSMTRAGCPCVLALRGGNLPDFARKHPTRVRKLLNMAAMVTSPSRYLKEELKTYRSDICLLANPIELSRYAYRQRLSAQPSLIWLRAFHEIYNPTMAVRVLSEIKTHYPTASLTMVGPDKGDGSMRRVIAEARRLNVTDALTLIPGVPKSQVPTALQHGDIFLNTTDVDNMPVSVLEAMACGLSIVSTNVGGLKYLLTHNKNALLVPAADVRGMSAAVNKLVVDQDLFRRLSETGRRFAEQHDWSLVYPQWDQLLSQAMSGRDA